MTSHWFEPRLGFPSVSDSVVSAGEAKATATVLTGSMKNLTAADRVKDQTNNARSSVTLATLSSPQPPPFQFGPIVVGPNGRARLVITNEPGKPFTLEASVDLINWITLDTITTNQSPVEYRDAGAVGLSQRFYRARQ